MAREKERRRDVSGNWLKEIKKFCFFLDTPASDLL